MGCENSTCSYRKMSSFLLVSACLVCARILPAVIKKRRLFFQFLKISLCFAFGFLLSFKWVCENENSTLSYHHLSFSLCIFSTVYQLGSVVFKWGCVNSISSYQKMPSFCQFLNLSLCFTFFFFFGFLLFCRNVCDHCCFPEKSNLLL